MTRYAAPLPNCEVARLRGIDRGRSRIDVSIGVARVGRTRIGRIRIGRVKAGLACALVALGCGQRTDGTEKLQSVPGFASGTTPLPADTTNELTVAEQKAGWRSLFDGKTFQG